jgi:hypothetical protein
MNSVMVYQSQDCKQQVAQVMTDLITLPMVKDSWDRLLYHELALKVLHIATSSASDSITL